MSSGYIKYYRKSLDNPLFKNIPTWHFWDYCLLKASISERDIFISGKIIKLLPGSFVFGRKVAAEETGLSEQQIRTCIKNLKKCQNLTIKSTKQFSIISITNWDSYQNQNDSSNQQINQRATNEQPTSNHIQECKESKECKEVKKKIKKKKQSFSPPTLEDVKSYFLANGFSEAAGTKAWNYYQAANWIDVKGNPVKNWKQKMIGVWFKDENKINGKINSNHGRLSRSEQNALACQQFIEGAGDEK